MIELISLRAFQYKQSKMDHNKPDLILLEKMEKICYLVDVAFPFDPWMEKEEKEKVKYYTDMKYEFLKMWKWGNQSLHCSGCNWCFRDGLEKHKQMSIDNWIWWFRKTSESMFIGSSQNFKESSWVQWLNRRDLDKVGYEKINKWKKIWKNIIIIYFNFF